MKKLLLRFIYVILAGVIFSAIVFLGAWAFIPAPAVTNFPVSPTLLDENGLLYHARLSDDGEWLLPVPLEKMSPWLPLVATAIEDKRFQHHYGVDPLALMRAIKQNIYHRRVVSGASTITVQVVRLTIPRSRNLNSKFVEFIQALKLERGLSKNEILEIYLNRAPFGSNIRGVEAASIFYFNKSAQDLSLGESALLVALLRGPSIYRPDKNPVLAKTRRDGLLELLVNREIITPEEAQKAKAEPIAGRRGYMPQQAWHFAELILPGMPGDFWRWGQAGHEYGLKTTLNLEVQHLLERRFLQKLKTFPKRITGAGAVMSNQNGYLLGYVGHARKLEEPNGHWVDCALAPRSPGSALKPFIYLTAFEDRKLVPASLLADTPLKLSGQAPRNFDEYYRGPVSAGAALAESLNAPAVRVLRRAGRNRSLELMRRAGFEYLKQPGHYYGDSLAIGGCEVNLTQMVKAYGTLAREGRAVEPRYLPYPKGEPSKMPVRQIFSQGAAWMVNASLQDATRLNPGLSLNLPEDENGRLAFKTGTSTGLRDAWMAIYSPDLTAVLWMGDPNGHSHQKLAAMDALGPVAVPLMGDLLKYYGSGPIKWPNAPADLETYEACSVSGQPVGPHCPGYETAHRLKTGAYTHPCRLHVLQNGQEVTLWPPELAGFMAARASSDRGFSKSPAIVSPLPGGLIVMNEGEGQVKMPLRCEGAVGRIYWFINDEFFQALDAGLTPMAPLKPGRHRIAMIDERNNTAKTEFTVAQHHKVDRDAELPVLSLVK